MTELWDNAIHEAGHVIAALAVGRSVACVWAQPDAGCAQLQLLLAFPTTSQIREQLLIDVAGWVSLALEDTKGSPVPPRFQQFVSTKLHYVSRKLRESGMLAGMLAELPPGVPDQRSDEAQAWDAVCRLPGSFVERLAEVERAESRAEGILRRNWRCVTALASALYRKGDGCLTEAEVGNIVGAAGGVFPLTKDGDGS
jgi:hypothetical protein